MLLYYLVYVLNMPALLTVTGICVCVCVCVCLSLSVCLGLSVCLYLCVIITPFMCTLLCHHYYRRVNVALTRAKR